MRSGRPFPPWDRRPALRDDVRWVWEAYWRLSSCRPAAQVMLPIPWTAVDAYARAHEITDAARFEHLVEAMDTEYLALLSKRGD